MFFQFETLIGPLGNLSMTCRKIRAPSFVNLSILPELLPGCLVSDVPAVLGSLDFVMGECDR